MTISSSNTHMLSIICSVFDAYSATLFLPQEHEDACELAAFFSLGNKVMPDAVIVPGRGLAGWVLRNKQPLLVPNFDQCQSNLGYYRENEEATIKAFMGCPISMGGILCVDSKRQYSFSDKDHKILQMFAELIAQHHYTAAPENTAGDIPHFFAQLGIMQDLRFRYKRWSQFLQHFLIALHHATGFDYCAFASVDPEGETYVIEGESARLLLDGKNTVRLPLNSGLVGWVLRDEKQPIFSEGIDGTPPLALFGKLPDMPEFKAVICMPVVVNKSTCGALCLAHSASKVMDEPLRSFMHQSVDHLGLFLENLYLKARLQSLLPKVHLHTKGSNVHDPDMHPPHYGEE